MQSGGCKQQVKQHTITHRHAQLIITDPCKLKIELDNSARLTSSDACTNVTFESVHNIQYSSGRETANLLKNMQNIEERQLLKCGYTNSLTVVLNPVYIIRQFQCH